MDTIKTEVVMTDNGDDEQWLYGESNSNLDPAGTSAEDVLKPAAELAGVPEDEVMLL